MVAYSEEAINAMRIYCNSLPEKDRRHYAAVEAIKLGWGGDTYISKLLGVARSSIHQGTKEIKDETLRQQIPSKKQRRPGGGAKKKLKTTGD